MTRQEKRKKYAEALRDLIRNDCSVFLLVKDKKIRLIAFVYGASHKFYFVSGVTDQGKYLVGEVKYNAFNPFEPEELVLPLLTSFKKKDLEELYRKERRFIERIQAHPEDWANAIYDYICNEEVSQVVFTMWVQKRGYQVIPIGPGHRSNLPINDEDYEDDI